MLILGGEDMGDILGSVFIIYDFCVWNFRIVSLFSFEFVKQE